MDLQQVILFSVVVVVGLGFFVFVLISLSNIFKKRKLQKKIDHIVDEDKLIAIDELRRYLKENPEDYKSRGKLIDLLYEQKMYMPTIKECTIMINLAASHSDIDELDYTIKMGECYYKLGSSDDARKYFMIARKMDDNNFKVNFNLGKMEYDAQSYDKALKYLNTAQKIDPSAIEVFRYKGFASFNLGLYRDAINSLGKVLKDQPTDTDILYFLGMSYFHANSNENAKKILTRIGPDHLYQPQIKMTLGDIMFKEEMFIKAIELYNMALSSNKLKPKEVIKIHMSMAECYVKAHNIPQALASFENVARINPNYKDVQKKIEMYSQLNKNSLLEKYLIGSVSQYTNICKLIVKYFISKKSNVKGKLQFIDSNINYKNELEIFVEISSSKFTMQYYFIFYRTTNTIGELEVRGIYNMLKDKKVDKGICISAGDFNDAAINFAETRMLEVVDKAELSKILNNIGIMLKQQEKGK
ncbi:MAG: tetratricopeptide repeat protein [Spirochaetes bacterium]|nr:tetratricopeptide repeat protein [Spirochaetota bacterium]